MYFIQLLWGRRQWVGAHSTDHENNKIKQEHCKDPVSLGLDQACRLMDEKPTAAQGFAMLIRQNIFNLHHSFYTFVFRLVMKVSLGEVNGGVHHKMTLSDGQLRSILGHDGQRNKQNDRICLCSCPPPAALGCYEWLVPVVSESQFTCLFCFWLLILMVSLLKHKTIKVNWIKNIVTSEVIDCDCVLLLLNASTTQSYVQLQHDEQLTKLFACFLQT